MRRWRNHSRRAIRCRYTSSRGEATPRPWSLVVWWGGACPAQVNEVMSTDSGPPGPVVYPQQDQQRRAEHYSALRVAKRLLSGTDHTTGDASAAAAVGIGATIIAVGVQHQGCAVGIEETIGSAQHAACGDRVVTRAAVGLELGVLQVTKVGTVGVVGSVLLAGGIPARTGGREVGTARPGGRDVP